MKSVAILDVGTGSTNDLVKVLEGLSARVEVTREQDVVMNADGVIVADSGEFADLMDELKASRCDRFIERRLAGGRGVLAIGTGMHVMFDSIVGEAHRDGLGQWRGGVERLDGPHMGIARVSIAEGSQLFAGMSGAEFYFDHPAAVRNDFSDEMAEHPDLFDPPLVSMCEEPTFVAAVDNGALCATQFHPERSGDAGVQLLSNWLERL